MCLICIEYQKEKMTIPEARRALGEMRVALDPTHVREVEEMLDADDGDLGAWITGWDNFLSHGSD